MTVRDKLPRLLQIGVTAEVLNRYQEPHRFYDTLAHLDDLIDQLYQRNLDDNLVLLLATVYHDIIYDPQSGTNEEDSARYFDETFVGDEAIKSEVRQIILDTKTHHSSTELSAVFCEIDLAILNRPLSKLLIYEHQIFKEFQFADYKLYQQKRVEVLQQLRQQINNPALDALITYVTHRQPNIAVYPGSFNPFHKGHLNILEKAEQIFDKVIIARGINPQKEASTHQLPDLLRHRQQTFYNGFLTDFTENLGYPITIIRGLRNSTDLQYELNQYRYLQDLSNTPLNIVSIFFDREFEHISSSGIRQLENYNKAGRYLLV